MAFRNADGSTNITIVSGASLVGHQASDGSVNVVVTDGSTYTGRVHPSGATNAVLSTGPTLNRSHPSGGVLISTNGNYQNGSAKVNDLVGTLSSAYTGQVATRCYVPTATNVGIPQCMSRTGHFARDAITSLQIAIPNWYVHNSTFIETGTGTAASVTASVEYPAATFTQILFSGIAAGSVADLTTLVSDATSVSIPAGAKFFIRIWRNNVNGMVYTGSIAQDTSNGDFFRYGSSITDQTMSGVITSSDTSNQAFPCAIIASTRKASIALLGDSRVAGLNDTFSDSSGDKGQLARAIGPSMAYINLGVPSDQAVKYVASHALRTVLASYCSCVLHEYGINDLATSARTDAQLRTDMTTIAGYTSTKKNIIVTMPPSTTGAWTAADGSDQTVKSFEAFRTANNAWRLTTPAGFYGYIDIAQVVEQNGKWKAPGFTTDGVHETNAACITERDSRVISLYALNR